MSISKEVSYFPVLRRKSAELKALQRANEQQSRSFCPIVFFKDQDVQTRKKTAACLDLWLQHTFDFPLAFNVSIGDWSKAADIVERSLVQPNALACFTLNEIRHARSAAERVHARCDLGCVVMLKSPEALSSDAIDRVVKLSHKLPVQVVIDFGVWDRDSNELAELATKRLERVQESGLGTAVVLAGSYPRNNTGLTQEAQTELVRGEWQAFKLICESVPAFFGDYGPVNALPRDENIPGSKEVTPAIRYTVEDAFVVFRGKRVMWDNFKDQVKQLAKSVCDSEWYYGTKFSWGDLQLECITRSSAEVAPGEWKALRAIEWSHHLAVASRDAESLVSRRAPTGAPSAARGS